MKAGFSKREITPPPGMELGGYAGYRPNSGVHDPLWCKVVVLEQAGVLYALAALDLMCADESLCGAIAEAVAQLGIKKQNLIVAAIHSHAAPAGVLPAAGALAGINEAIVPENPAFPAYMQAVITAAFAACAEAAGNLESFRLRTARGQMPPVGSERHTGEKAEGTLTVAEFLLQSGRKLLFYSFPCHPTVLPASNLLVSADFVGEIEKHLDADMTIFANGAAGDISTRFTRREATFAECARMGALAADYIRALLATAAFQEPELTGRTDVVTLPARRVETPEQAQEQLEEAVKNWQRAVDSGTDAATVRILRSYVEGAGVNLDFARSMAGIREFSVPVTIFRFGTLRFVTVPGEFYSTLTIPDTVAICYANGYYRYIADRNAYDSGHYEAMAAIIDRTGGELLANTLRQLLDSI